MPTLKEDLKEIRVAVYILVSLFAISSWIDINSLFVELPILVSALPEGWDLPSYIVLIIQVANIGPLLYTIANRCAPDKIKEWPFVYVIIGIGCVSSMLMAFLWDRTTYFNGKEHSTALLSLTAFLALVDTTSSVVFLPYMALLKPQYMTAFYLGEGLCSFIPGVVGLIQGVGDFSCVNFTSVTTNKTTGINTTSYAVWPVYDDPLFSVQTFFIFVFFMIVISGVAFTCIHFLAYCKQERISEQSGVTSSTNNQLKPRSINDICYDNAAFTKGDLDEIPGYKSKYQDTSTSPELGLTRVQYAYLLFLVGWACCLTNGVIPSTQSYSALPYGNDVYALTVRLSSVASPLAALIALFIPNVSRSLVAPGVISVIATVLAAYQLVLAGASPNPPLKHDPAGSALCVATAVLMTGLFAFVKFQLASILNARRGQVGLLWCGGMTQIGSCIGAVVTFVIVSVLHLLTSESSC